MPANVAGDLLFHPHFDELKFHILSGMPQIKLNILFWHKILRIFPGSHPAEAGKSPAQIDFDHLSSWIQKGDFPPVIRGKSPLDYLLLVGL
ncbi:hypothetical protein LZY01_15680 [Levilactobacillus zymae]|uniref:Uncharacterized protein n=1 Tax=Levilactobacillus zymae TaxID=267363 RepID=A0ABQ0WX11_9LACO|nr:hypothetical protein [Levilactobacillus zymae]QFR61991.1 hypothetical protein LZ395_10805 [Levilactobacillus zymae]GEO72400.1 hypothetical protein LZY01_15680 [Levilactobacillus zymae]